VIGIDGRRYHSRFLIRFPNLISNLSKALAVCLSEKATSVIKLHGTYLKGVRGFSSMVIRRTLFWDPASRVPDLTILADSGWI
jgi:hypothetical protein